jgi:hypothetical protein
MLRLACCGRAESRSIRGIEVINHPRVKPTIAMLGLCLAPKAQRHLEPWASPEEFELPRQQALKARFNRVSQSNWCCNESRFQRWRLATPQRPGALPQAQD